MAEEDKITPEFLAKFNAETKAVEAAIEAVRAGTASLVALTKEAQGAFSPDDQARISKKLAQEIKKSGDEAKKGKALLDAMKKRGETIVARNPKSECVAPYKNQYLRLSKLYLDVVKDHQKSKEAMRKAQEDTLVRRGEIIYGDTMSRDDIKSQVKKDPAKFLSDAVMTEASEEAQQAYVDAQSRSRDITALVRSLAEVQSMFNDLSVLVNQQSEMLDSIENNVESAQTYIKKGNQSLKDAQELQKKTRKCYCCLLCIVISIVIALIAGLGTFFGGAFKSS